jgi:MFS transporter, DHA2 family, multidrug resistance protein
MTMPFTQTIGRRLAQAPNDYATSDLREPRRTVAITSVLAAMVLVVLDAAIANVALPTITQSLHVTPAMSVWVITAYQTALLMALLPCAALGESLGYRRVFPSLPIWMRQSGIRN